MAGRGHALALVDQNERRLESVAGADVLARSADVTDEESIASIVEETVERFGCVTALFNNAGISGGTFPLGAHPLEDFRRTIDVNLVGMFVVLKRVLPVVARNSNGWVVCMASGAGLKANARCGAYAASKAGVIQLSRAAALEYGGRGIRVNALCPGPLEGELMRLNEAKMPDPEDYRGRLTAVSAVDRYGTPEEVAGFVTYLLTEAPGYLTGAILPSTAAGDEADAPSTTATIETPVCPPKGGQTGTSTRPKLKQVRHTEFDRRCPQQRVAVLPQGNRASVDVAP